MGLARTGGWEGGGEERRIFSRPSLMIIALPGGTGRMFSGANPKFNKATLSLAAANNGP